MRRLDLWLLFHRVVMDSMVGRYDILATPDSNDIAYGHIESLPYEDPELLWLLK